MRSAEGCAAIAQPDTASQAKHTVLWVSAEAQRWEVRLSMVFFIAQGVQVSTHQGRAGHAMAVPLASKQLALRFSPVSLL